MGQSGFDHLRGDTLAVRRRRRRGTTLGTAAAVAMIAVVGVVAIGQGGLASGARTAPSPVDTPEPTPSSTEPRATIREDSTTVEDEVAVTIDRRSPAGTDGLTGDDIPDGFPLGLAHEDLTGDGGTVTGPGTDLLALQDELVCGDTLWTVSATDRVGFSSTGPAGYADVRELRTFGDTQDAVDQVTEIRTRLAGCQHVRGGTELLWVLHAEDTGYDSVTFGSTPEEGLGGAVFQVTRVGRSVVALARYGEWSPETAPQGAAELTSLTRGLAPEMCTFTAAGC